MRIMDVTPLMNLTQSLKPDAPEIVEEHIMIAHVVRHDHFENLNPSLNHSPNF